MTPPAQALPRKEQSLRILVTAVVCGFALVAGFVAYMLGKSYERHQASAEEGLQNLTLSIEYFLQAHFQAVDLALQSAATEFRRLDRDPFPAEEFSGFLSGLRQRLPNAVAIRASDETGVVRYGEGADPVKGISLATRQFFRDTVAEKRLVFGLPLKSRVSGEWVLPVAYPLTRRSGALGGVAYVNTDRARITALFASMRVGAHGVITLFDQGGRVLIRYPETGTLEDEQVLTLSAPATVALLTEGKHSATYKTRSSVDGLLRTLTFQRIGNYPLYLIVGLAPEDYLAPWKRECMVAGGMLAVLAAGILALCLGLRRSWQRRDEALAQALAAEAEQRQSVAALTVSEARFRALTDGLPQMVWLGRGDGSVDYFSHHWGEFTGLPVPDLLRGNGWRDTIHPEDRRRVAEAWAQAVGSGAEFGTVCRIRRRDGAWRVFDSRAVPQRDAAGEVVHWVGSCTDITEASEAREALLRAKEAAVEASKVKSEFVANMSHEIRTPLNGVLGLAQGGFRESPPSSRAREVFGRILKSGQLLLGIINDILDFSKIEAGKLSIESVPVGVRETLSRAVDMMQDRAADSGLRLHYSVAPDVPAWCLGDPLRLGQILMNLLSNAIKFTPGGEVGLEASRDGEMLLLRVTDTGIGMSQAQMERLFLPFEQADGTTTRRFGGTGLGLAITRRLVELLGGTISVTSEPDKGSCFEVRLPLVEVPMQVADPVPPPVVMERLKGLRVLAAEDNPVNQMVLEDNLRFEGALVTLVDNGLLAVERIAQDGASAYDVVLMDVMMPVMDGHEAASRIHAMAPSLPIIGQTAHAMVEEREQCLRSGMVDCITKPIDPDALVAVILARQVPPADPG